MGGCGGEESRFFQTKRSFPDSLGQKCLVPDLLSTTTIHSSRHLVFNAALHSAQIKGCIVGHIYKITLNNGRHYIGQTTRTNPDDRRQEHLDDYVKGTNKLYTEMRRVGIDGFKFKVLLRKYYPSFAALDRQENLFIEEYNTIEDGLNTLLAPKREL